MWLPLDRPREGKVVFSLWQVRKELPIRAVFTGGGGGVTQSPTRLTVPVPAPSLSPRRRVSRLGRNMCKLSFREYSKAILHNLFGV